MDHLLANVSNDATIVLETRDKLGLVKPRLLWLFQAPGMDMGSPEGDSHWLVDDGTRIVTTVHQPNRLQAYRVATGEGRPKTKQLLELEAAMLESEEKMLGASFDERLIGIVDIVWDPRYYPLDYGKIEKILDDLEAKYELKPIELVQAYQMCEARKKAEMEVSVDAET